MARNTERYVDMRNREPAAPRVVEREYTLAFGAGPLPGEQLPYALPTMGIPTVTLGNFTGC